MAVLNYAVESLRVEHIIVAGHSHCGGVAYCYPDLAEEEKDLCFGPLEQKVLPESVDNPLSQWLAPLRKRVEALLNEASSASPPQPKPELEEVIKFNVTNQVNTLVDLPVVRNAWMRPEDMNKIYLGPEGERNRRRLLGVHGWRYNLETGLVDDLGISRYSPNFTDNPQ